MTWPLMTWQRPSDAYKGKWIVGGEHDGQFEMSYLPTAAGPLHLFLWFETPVEGRKRWQRTQLPGCPFKVSCAPGKWHAHSSAVLVEWADSPNDAAQIIDPDDDLVRALDSS
jgi:hypothetical protein